MSIFHAGFGLGSLLAPVFVSLDLEHTGSFHHSYFLIGTLNILVRCCRLNTDLIRGVLSHTQQESQQII